MGKEAIDWSRREKEEAEKLVQDLAGFVNRMASGAGEKRFVERVMREHRTLQQSIFALFLRTIEEWSKQEHFDLRNEFTVKKSKEIMELLFGSSGTPFV